MEELQSAKLVLYEKLKFADVMGKFSDRIEETYSASFSHKCTCPNPKHKNGRERTPSFYFSESQKNFVCFGCNLFGDMFDIIALMEGMPWYNAVRIFLEKEKIDLNEINLESFKGAGAYNNNYVYECNLKLGVELRDYLSSLTGTPYDIEKKWVDSIFKRMDDRFEKLGDEDASQARAFKAQILLELDRHKKGVI